MIATLTKTDYSKNNKLRAYFDNKHGWRDAFYCGQNVALPEIGTVMDVNTVAKQFKRDDGSESTLWFIQGWGKVPAGSVSTAAPSGFAAAPAASVAVVATNPNGLAVQPADSLRFVSNMVGSAITSGAIKAPTDMALWAVQAYRIVRAIQNGALLEDNRKPAAPEPVPAPIRDDMRAKLDAHAPPPREAGDPGPVDDPFGDPVPF